MVIQIRYPEHSQARVLQFNYPINNAQSNELETCIRVAFQLTEDIPHFTLKNASTGIFTSVVDVIDNDLYILVISPLDKKLAYDYYKKLVQEYIHSAATTLGALVLALGWTITSGNAVIIFQSVEVLYVFSIGWGILLFCLFLYTVQYANFIKHARDQLLPYPEYHFLEKENLSPPMHVLYIIGLLLPYIALMCTLLGIVIVFHTNQ